MKLREKNISTKFEISKSLIWRRTIKWKNKSVKEIFWYNCIIKTSRILICTLYNFNRQKIFNNKIYNLFCGNENLTNM